VGSCSLHALSRSSEASALPVSIPERNFHPYLTEASAHRQSEGRDQGLDTERIKEGQHQQEEQNGQPVRAWPFAEAVCVRVVPFRQLAQRFMSSHF
jgi:hypothetical protein